MGKIKWSNSSSMKLSRAIVVVFVFILLGVDIGGWKLAEYIVTNAYSVTEYGNTIMLIIVIYVCSVPGYFTLYCLYKLLRNIEKHEVFISQNVKYLQLVSWNCIFVAVILCIAAVTIWFSLGIVAVAAGFMALIVRVVKNVFEQAVRMKDELEFLV